MKVVPKTRHARYIEYLRFYLYHQLFSECFEYIQVSNHQSTTKALNTLNVVPVTLI